jgi:hypothetical protein
MGQWVTGDPMIRIVAYLTPPHWRWGRVRCQRHGPWLPRLPPSARMKVEQHADHPDSGAVVSSNPHDMSVIHA